MTSQGCKAAGKYHTWLGGHFLAMTSHYRRSGTIFDGQPAVSITAYVVERTITPILQMRKLRSRVSGLGHGAYNAQSWDFNSRLC